MLCIYFLVLNFYEYIHIMHQLNRQDTYQEDETLITLLEVSVCLKVGYIIFLNFEFFCCVGIFIFLNADKKLLMMRRFSFYV